MLIDNLKSYIQTATDSQTDAQIEVFLDEHPKELYQIYESLVSPSPSNLETSLTDRSVSSEWDSQLIDKIVSHVESHLNKEHKSLLFNEIASGHLNQLKILISKGLNPNVTNEDGQTLLAFALMHGQYDMALYLMDLTKDIQATFGTEDSYLHLAVRHLPDSYSSAPVIHKLCELGIPVDKQNAKDETPLILAAQQGSLQHQTHLLRRSPNLEISDATGKTALMQACENGPVDVIQDLLTAGANVDATDHDGKTSLLIACQTGKLEIVELLTSNNATISTEDAKGRTPLSIASEQQMV